LSNYSVKYDSSETLSAARAAVERSRKAIQRSKELLRVSKESRRDLERAIRKLRLSFHASEIVLDSWQVTRHGSSLHFPG